MGWRGKKGSRGEEKGGVGRRNGKAGGKEERGRKVVREGGER